MWLLYYFIALLKFVTVSQHSDRGWKRTCVPTDINPFITHPAHERLSHTAGVYAPYSLYEQQCGFFYVPQEQEQWKSCEAGPTVFRLCQWRQECLTICRYHNKGSAFSSVILRPWLLVRPEFEPVTSFSAEGRLSNWADRAAVLVPQLPSTYTR